MILFTKLMTTFASENYDNNRLIAVCRMCVRCMKEVMLDILDVCLKSKLPKKFYNKITVV